MKQSRFDPDRIVSLANQIAENQFGMSETEAVKMVATHINAFWNSSMKQVLHSLDEKKLHPFCAKALEDIN